MKKIKQIRGHVFYDADCNLCDGLVRHLSGPFRRAGFAFKPLQSAIASGAYSIPASEFLREMKLLRSDGTWCGGVDAWIEIFRDVKVLRPVAWLIQKPFCHSVTVRFYRWFAAHRGCFGGTCSKRRRVFFEDP